MTTIIVNKTHKRQENFSCKELNRDYTNHRKFEEACQSLGLHYNIQRSLRFMTGNSMTPRKTLKTPSELKQLAAKYLGIAKHANDAIDIWDKHCRLAH